MTRTWITGCRRSSSPRVGIVDGAWLTRFMVTGGERYSPQYDTIASGFAEDAAMVCVLYGTGGRYTTRPRRDGRACGSKDYGCVEGTL